MNIPMPLEEGTHVTLSYFAQDLQGVVKNASVFQDATKEGCPVQQSIFIKLEPSAVADNLGNALLWAVFDAQGNGVSNPYVFIKSIEAVDGHHRVDVARELAHYQSRVEKLEAFVRYVRDMPGNIVKRWALDLVQHRAEALLPKPKIDEE